MFKVLLVVSLIFSATTHAATRMGKATSDVYFKIDGKGKHTAQEADANADDHTIEKCSPIKGSEPPAYKCVEVVKEFNPRNGNPTWKRP